jgi:hypothetical protein
MKTVVFSFNPPTPDGSLANARTATFIADTLDVPLICDKNIADVEADVLILVAGVFMYCRCLPEVGAAVEKAKRVVWAQNDYTIKPPLAEGIAESPFRKAFRNRRAAGLPDVDFWTTMKKASEKTPFSAWVNWNQMAYETPISDEAFELNREHAIESFIYYGADRLGRRDYFDWYFNGQKAPLTISSFSKSMSRYEADADIIPAFKRTEFFDRLGQYSAGLYLEDKRSHAEFTSPATRFYEMLRVGVAMFFQPQAVPMLAKAGFDVAPFVATPGQLPDALGRATEVARLQRALWGGKPYLRNLKEQLLREYARIQEGVK